MTITTASDTIPQSLLDLLTANGLRLVDPEEVAGVPAGPFSATIVRQQGEIAAVILSLPSEDGASGMLERAVVGGYPTSQPDLPIAMGSLEELAAQVPIPLDVNAVTVDGRVVALLAVPVDRRSGPESNDPASQLRSSAPPDGVARPTGLAVTPGDGALGLLRNVTLEVTVELGRATLTFAQLLGLTIGSVVELDRAAGSPVDIRVNGMLFGRGEVVVVDDEYAVRVIEILNAEFSG